MLDPAMHDVVQRDLARGKLWPAALVQLSPAYDRACTVADLVEQGVLRNHPEDGRVRAIIVYLMNALINAQAQAIERFFANASGRCPVRFARYTGQENDAEKKGFQENPPHILLTNYVMLELMLTRPDEFAFVDASAADLQFVVLDELHTYRERQGADVAMLMRRLRERCGNPNLISAPAPPSSAVSRLTTGDRLSPVWLRPSSAYRSVPIK